MLRDILDLRFAFLSPVMADGEEDDDESEDEDEDADDDDAGSEANEAGSVDDGERKRLNDEAKKHRLRAKELAQKLRERERAEKEAEEKNKPELERLRSQVGSLKTVTAERDKYAVEVAVLRAAMENKITDVDYFMFKLEKGNHLKLDEEGDLPDTFDEAVKKLAKELSTSEKDETESESSEFTGKKVPPKSPTLSTKKQGKSTDPNSLAKKYPALLGRSS